MFFYYNVNGVIRIGKKGSKTGYEIKCENCQKDIYRTIFQYNRAKHHFCSGKCQKEFQARELYEDRKCEMCENTMKVRKKYPQRFCSPKCQHEWQKLNVGDKNPKFKGKKIKCEYCNKEYFVGKRKIESKQHNFCCNSCRQAWYREVFSQSEEWRTKSRIRATNLLKNNKSTTKTTPQIKINSLLDKLSIRYENEKNCKYYSIDNYLVDYNLMIEVMGDFWHCNPITYPEVILDIHKRCVPKDRAKNSYIKKHYNTEILYLWESDINHNPILCEKLIQEFINNKGVLYNYHSFNYNVENGNLLLNKSIVCPHQDRASL